MTPLAGTPVLSAAAMRAAEAAAIAQGATVDSLMDGAGRGVAEAVRRLGGGSPVLILCGPGNNGGDGYVAATVLEDMGLPVRVAAAGDPKTEAAGKARARWTGAVEPLSAATGGPILVDALFGTGLSRPLDAEMAGPLARLAGEARLSIAVDLPSGVGTDDGAALGDVPCFNLTLALGAAKPAHLLQPAARFCGNTRLLDIGVPTDSQIRVLDRPEIPAPGPDAHKYSRGMVTIVGGTMPGAAALAAVAAMRAGAGYVLLLGECAEGSPQAVVHRPWTPEALGDKRIGALLIGPGLGRDGEGGARLDHALASKSPLVIDGDALKLLDSRRLKSLRARAQPAILTPHAGEFAALFGKPRGSKIDAAIDAARRSGAIVVFKGADTVIAAPDGSVRLAGGASDWLSTAGTGDVLAGAIAAVLASGLDPMAAASAGVWLHGAAARQLGAAFIADDLAYALTAARAAL